MIKEIQSFWAESEKKRIKTVAEQFHLSLPCAKKYIYMSSKELEELDTPKNYKKRESAMNEWLNVIFKMMLDGHTNETIYFYIKEHPDFNESEKKLQKYIYLIGKNNFPDRIPFNANYLMEKVLPPDVICFKRTEILKYLLTCNPKKQKDLEEQQSKLSGLQETLTSKRDELNSKISSTSGELANYQAQLDRAKAADEALKLAQNDNISGSVISEAS